MAFPSLMSFLQYLKIQFNGHFTVKAARASQVELNYSLFQSFFIWKQENNTFL